MAKSAINQLSVTVRTETGKGASRRARRNGNIPAVLYGHGEAPQHLELPGHDFAAVLRQTQLFICLADAVDLLPGAGQQLLLLGLDRQRAGAGRDARRRILVQLVQPGRRRRLQPVSLRRVPTTV